MRDMCVWGEGSSQRTHNIMTQHTRAHKYYRYLRTEGQGRDGKGPNIITHALAQNGHACLIYAPDGGGTNLNYYLPSILAGPRPRRQEPVARPHLGILYIFVHIVDNLI